MKHNVTLARIVASRFDVAHLNRDALVVIPDLDVVMELRGWDASRSAWECFDPASKVAHFSAEIADAYMCRRVAFHYAGRPGATYPHLGEMAPAHQQLVAELAEQVEATLGPAENLP